MREFWIAARTSVEPLATAAATALAALTTLAAGPPARRAARTDPLTVLRME
jgi:ABC-type lipoprotein release transport system permease subunit